MSRASRLIPAFFAAGWLVVCAIALREPGAWAMQPLAVLAAAALVLLPPVVVWTAFATAPRPNRMVHEADEHAIAVLAARLHGEYKVGGQQFAAAVNENDRTAVHPHAEQVPSRSAAADDDAASRARLSEQETALAALWAAHDERHALATAQTQALTKTVALLRAEREAFTRQLEMETANLHALAAAVCDKTDVARAGLRDGAWEQHEALGAEIERVRAAFTALAGEGHAAATRQVEGLIAAADALSVRLVEQERQTLGLVGTVERGFSILDARLAHAASGAGTTLNDLAVRLEHARGSLQSLSEPLSGVSVQVGTLNTALDEAQTHGLAVVDLLASALPEHSGAAHRAASTIEAAAAAAARASEGGLLAIADAATHAAALAAALEQVRGSAGEAEHVLAQASVETMARVRGTLAAIVDGHRDELARALADVDAYAARAAAAAQTAVERVTQSLAVLARAVSAMER